MKPDPILRELWKIKDGLSAECNHDLRSLFDRLKMLQKEQKQQLVNRTKRHMSVEEAEGSGYGTQAPRT